MVNLSDKQKKLVIQISLTLFPQVADYKKECGSYIRDNAQGKRVLAGWQRQGITLEDVNRYFEERKH